MFSLAKKVGLVVGIADEQSIACGGPLRTRAASGIAHFDELLNIASERAPTHQLHTIEDVGAHAVFLVFDGARNVTGGVHHIDGGYSITG